MLQLVEVDRHDSAAAVGKLDGLDVVVADAASLVGKRLRVRVERVLDGRAYAVLVRKTKEAPEPLTAEGEAEKPTRKPPARKGAGPAREAELAEAEEPVVVEEAQAETEIEPAAEEATDAEETQDDEEAPKPKKKTRRGSRGGRNRKKKPAAASQNGGEPPGESKETAKQPEEPPSASDNGDFDYVPMSEWADELETNR